MRANRVSAILMVAALSAAAWAQSWSEAYEQGLSAAKSKQWAVAREAFLNAAAMRPEDQSEPTRLPAPVTERREWRNGSPYSPNFLAAYSAYRSALEEKNDEVKTGILRTAAMELSTLIDKNQRSAETFYFLNQIYIVLNDAQMQREVETRWKAQPATWRVDTSVLDPNETAALAAITGQAVANNNQGNQSGMVNPTQVIGVGNQSGNQAGNQATTPPVPTGPSDRVPVVATKFALIIGNSESSLDNYKQSFAQNDANLLRDALLQHAGYADENTVILLNVSAEEIKNQAAALAERMPQDATLFLFFAGAGFNIDGKDYLAGVDVNGTSDTSRMVAKVELFRPFFMKGARVFSFFQVRRAMANGRYFGEEVPIFGFLSQMQSTMSGGDVIGLMNGGSVNGVFTRALVAVLQRYRTNRVPIAEFGWQVFYEMRRVGGGTTGGGAGQTATLPALRNMGEDSRF
ncbi:MAG: caspase family protein [Fimbriimonadaceae bacterium]